MKKLFALFLVVFAVFGLVACGEEEKGEFKVGVVLVGDATEGYTLAHINGIKSAASELNLRDDQIVWKERIEENDNCKTAIEECIAAGCTLIISNSYGHQDFMYQVAKKNPKVTFVASTGDFASICGLNNLKNAFTNVYESRYVSGVVAGLKLQELVNNNALTAENKDANGNIKIGYVGAYTYAEVISGYTAFYLGIKSVVSNVVMEVQFTDEWFDIEAEAAAAELLVNRGCVIIGQHADSTGAPSKCQQLLTSGKVCYSVGYNIDMLEVAKTAALTSATNNWGVYYKYAFEKAMNGEEIATNWSEGYSTNAVGITALGSSCAEGTQAKVDEVVANLKNGTLHVFDCSKFTVDGQNITSSNVDLSYMDYTTATPTVIFAGETFDAVKTDGTVSYFEESVKRSAPYFGLKIDGITWLNK